MILGSRHVFEPINWMSAKTGRLLVKMITIRRICFGALVLMAPLYPAMAQTASPHVEIHAPAQTYTTSISTGVGMLLGSAKEFVYDNGYKLSELDWSLSPVLYYESRLTLSTTSGFEALIDVKSGFSGLSGSITDSDYLNYDGVKTHFSKHDCYTERAVSVDIRAGWPAITAPRIVVSMLGFLDVLDYKWSARDGYLQYPPTGQTSPNYTPWSESTTKSDVVGTGIVYEQGYFALGLMLDARLKMSEGVSGTLGVGYAPIALCSDIDNHLFTGVDYYEKMSGGYMLHAEASMEFLVRPDSILSLGGSYRLIQGLIGDTRMVYTSAQNSVIPGTIYTFSNSAGASLSVFDMNMRMTFNL
jgi:outer membrane protease